MVTRSSLGFGCVGLTTYTFESEANRMLSLVYDQGITLFDTAPLYGRTYSEKILGKFIKNKRDKLIVTTKVGLGGDTEMKLPASVVMPLYALKRKLNRTQISNIATVTTPPNLLLYRKITKEYVEQSLESSLKNLKTDYIDNYLLHEAMPSFLTEAAHEYLLIKKETGVIKHLGIAAGYVNIENVEESTFSKWDCVQYENNHFYDSNAIMKQLPNKKHIHHSVLKFLKLAQHDEFTMNQKAGILLNQAARLNKNGYVLFSTTNRKSLIANLQELENANKFTAEKLNSIVDAFY